MNKLTIFPLISALLLAPLFGVAQPLTTVQAGNGVAGNLPSGNDLTRHWIADPAGEAVCNDGTTPAAYVRSGSGDGVSRWVIHLQGGGSCQDGDDCLNRWQSLGGQPNYGLQKMSTSIDQATWDAWYPALGAPNGWAAEVDSSGTPVYRIPSQIAGNGIFLDDPAINPEFADWNHVLLYYCSSDSHAGQASAQTITGSDELAVPPAATSYDISFRGDTIFDQLIADLRGGVIYLYKGEKVGMDSLDDAELIILSGSSAGSNGVKHQLDRFRASQLAINAQTRVRGVFDAAGNPPLAEEPWPVPPAAFTSHQDRINFGWHDVFVALWKGQADDSCLLENPAETISRCRDTTHLMRHHVTTPFFHRMDLQDSNPVGMWQAWYPAPYPPALGPMQMATQIAQQLVELQNTEMLLAPRYPAEYATMLADPDWVPPGLFGPRCGTHVALTNNLGFFGQQLPGPAGAPTSYAELLALWVNAAPAGAGVLGGGVALIADPGVGPQGLPFCP